MQTSEGDCIIDRKQTEWLF